MSDMVFLIPACGNGTRTASRGIKPFIGLKDGTTVFQRVLAQCPDFARPVIVLPTWNECASPGRPMQAIFMNPTSGQANTVYLWLESLSEIPDWILISNCDNAIGHADIAAMLAMIELKRGPTGIATGLNGVVAVIKPDETNRWSYCHLNEKGYVNKITEKFERTEHAVCGVYLLRGTALATLLFGTDEYLSQVISRMREVAIHVVKEYHGWNDMEQIREWEAKHVNK